MSLLYLLDTNVVSELAKPVPNAPTVLAIREHEARCAISAITLEELSFGCALLASAARRQWFKQWLQGMVARLPVLPFDRNAAIWLGQERARLRKLGRPAPRTDGEIAAIAFTQDLTLVTHNTADFAGFAGLRVQDWHG